MFILGRMDPSLSIIYVCRELEHRSSLKKKKQYKYNDKCMGRLGDNEKIMFKPLSPMSPRQGIGKNQLIVLLMTLSITKAFCEKIYLLVGTITILIINQ